MERDKIIRILEWLEWLKSNTRYSDEAEIELTISLIKELTEEIKDLEEDYERVYEQAAADIHGNMADGGTSCHWCIAGHKRDTVHKMQAMIKEECLAGGIYPAFVARVVENVGEKLLEGK